MIISITMAHSSPSLPTPHGGFSVPETPEHMLQSPEVGRRKKPPVVLLSDSDSAAEQQPPECAHTLPPRRRIVAPLLGRTAAPAPGLPSVPDLDAYRFVPPGGARGRLVRSSSDSSDEGEAASVREEGAASANVASTGWQRRRSPGAAPAPAPAPRRRRVRRDAADSESEEGSETSGEYDSDGGGEEGGYSGLDEAAAAAALQELNEEAPEALAALLGISVEQARTLAALRPFGAVRDAANALDDVGGAGAVVLHGRVEAIAEARRLDEVLERCRGLSAVLATATAAVAQQLPELPDLLAQEEGKALRPFQLEGVRWLSTLHEHGVNGILADEMGLGKTVQAIAFIACLASECPEAEHLVVVPSSVLENWVREFECWAPGLSVACIKGSLKERAALRRRVRGSAGTAYAAHVLLATYDVVTSKHDSDWFRGRAFKSMTLDEGHRVKNMRSQGYAALMRLRAERRLLLTGTPIQNSLLELFSLLSFIMPKVFAGNTEVLDKHLSRNATSQVALQKAKIIMEPFVLRRRKCDVLTDLPPKRVEVVPCPLAGAHRVAYTALLATFRERLAPQAAAAGVGAVKNAGELKNAVMQLRKLANHPLLHRIRYDDSRLAEMVPRIMREPEHSQGRPEYVLEDMRPPGPAQR